MQTELINPRLDLAIFNCPHCGALSHAKWMELLVNSFGSSGRPPQPCRVAITACCPKRMSIWLVEEDDDQISATMIYPSKVNAPPPHPDMPEEMAVDFEEARMVFGQSPRSAAALLRLCLEKLCNHLVGNDKGSIHDKIGKLVAQGLPVEVQQALDATKIIGNNAIHVIELDIAANPDLALSLFGLINFIVDNRISQPAKIAVLYAQLPAGARAAIDKRDKPKT